MVLSLLEKVTSSNFFSRILRNEGLVNNSYFFRTAVLWKLFDIRCSYKHCNFSRVCLLVKMASKTGKVYSIPLASHSFRTFHLLPPVTLPPPFSPRLPLPSSHKQKATANQLSLAATACVIWLCVCVRYWPGSSMSFAFNKCQCPLLASRAENLLA